MASLEVIVILDKLPNLYKPLSFFHTAVLWVEFCPLKV